jgi:hypothetical protein
VENIANLSRIKLSERIKLLIDKLDWVNEKLSHVFEMIKSKDEVDSFDLCESMLELDRLRYTVVIHYED